MIDIAKQHRYGWIPDLPDCADFRFSHSISPAALPDQVDLRDNMPPVYDQGELGSCTANAIGAAHHYAQMKQLLSGNANTSFTPSRLMIYRNERVMEGTVDEDAGAMIRDGVKSIAKQGVCPESEWPYIISRFRDEPPASATAHALDHQALIYMRVNRVLNDLRGCLALNIPAIIGFTVYESFESEYVYMTGKMPMPGTREKALGGHAVLVVGYDSITRRWLVRNSWGPKWGIKGYFWMPFEYLLNPDLSDDFWKISLVEQ